MGYEHSGIVLYLRTVGDLNEGLNRMLATKLFLEATLKREVFFKEAKDYMNMMDCKYVLVSGDWNNPTYIMEEGNNFFVIKDLNNLHLIKM